MGTYGSYFDMVKAKSTGTIDKTAVKEETITGEYPISEKVATGTRYEDRYPEEVSTPGYVKEESMQEPLSPPKITQPLVTSLEPSPKDVSPTQSGTAIDFIQSKIDTAKDIIQSVNDQNVEKAKEAVKEFQSPVSPKVTEPLPVKPVETFSLTPPTSVEKFKYDIAKTLPGDFGQEQLEDVLAETTSGISYQDWKQAKEDKENISNTITSIDNTLNTLKTSGGQLFDGEKYLDTNTSIRFLENQKSDLQSVQSGMLVTIGSKTFDPVKDNYADFRETFQGEISKSIIGSKPDVYRFVPSSDYESIMKKQMTGSITQKEAQDQLSVINLQKMESAPRTDVVDWGKQYLDFDPDKEGQQTFLQKQSKEPAIVDLTYDPKKPVNEQFSFKYDYTKAQREEMESLPWYGKIAKGALDIGTQFPRAISVAGGEIYRGLSESPELRATGPIGAGIALGKSILSGDYQKELEEQVMKGGYDISQSARLGHETGQWIPYVSKTVGLESPFTTDILLPAVGGYAVGAFGPAIGSGASKVATKVATKVPTLAKVGQKVAPSLAKVGTTLAQHPIATTGIVTGGITAPMIAPTALAEYSGQLPSGTTAEQLTRVGVGLMSFGAGMQSGQQALRLQPQYGPKGELEIPKTVIEKKLPGIELKESTGLGAGRRAVRFLGKEYAWGDIIPVDLASGQPITWQAVEARLGALARWKQPTPTAPSLRAPTQPYSPTPQLYAYGEMPAELMFEGATVPPSRSLVPVSKPGALVPSGYVFEPYAHLYNQAMLARGGSFPTATGISPEMVVPIRGLQKVGVNEILGGTYTVKAGPEEWARLSREAGITTGTGKYLTGPDIYRYEGKPIGLEYPEPSSLGRFDVKSTGQDTREMLKMHREQRGEVDFGPEVTLKRGTLARGEFVDLPSETMRLKRSGKIDTGQGVAPYQAKLEQYGFDLGPDYINIVQPVAPVSDSPKFSWQEERMIQSPFVESKPPMETKILKDQTTLNIIKEPTDYIDINTMRLETAPGTLRLSPRNVQIKVPKKEITERPWETIDWSTGGTTQTTLPAFQGKRLALPAPKVVPPEAPYQPPVQFVGGDIQSVIADTRASALRRGIQTPPEKTLTISSHQPPTSLGKAQPSEYFKLHDVPIRELRQKPTRFDAVEKRTFLGKEIKDDVSIMRINPKTQEGGQISKLLLKKSPLEELQTRSRLDEQQHRGMLERQKLQQERIKERVAEKERQKELLKKYEATKRIKKMFPEKQVYQLNLDGNRFQLVWEGDQKSLLELLDTYDRYLRVLAKTKKKGPEIKIKDLKERDTLRKQLRKTFNREKIDMEYVDGVLIATKFRGMPNILKTTKTFKLSKPIGEVPVGTGPGTVQVLKTVKKTTTIKKPKTGKLPAPSKRDIKYIPPTEGEARLLHDLDFYEEGIVSIPKTGQFAKQPTGLKGRGTGIDLKPGIKTYGHKKPIFVSVPITDYFKGSDSYKISENIHVPKIDQDIFSIPKFDIGQEPVLDQTQINIPSQDQTQIQAVDIPSVSIQQPVYDLSPAQAQAQLEALSFVPEYRLTQKTTTFAPPILPEEEKRKKHERSRFFSIGAGRYSIHYDVPKIWMAPQYTKQLYRRKK